MVSGTTKVLSVAGLLTCGCLNTIVSKIQFTMDVVGVDGQPKKFEKPFFATFTMFASMFVVLGYHLASKRSQQKAGSEALLEEAQPKMSEWKAFLLISIPATFDLAATGLMLWGLLLMSSSIYQMLRGSMIIFAAIIRVTVFKHKLSVPHWLGVAICVAGVTSVGCSNVLNSGFKQPGKTITAAESSFGVFLVIFAQILQASQLVAEEKFMKEVKLPPLQIVGYEGLWGLIEFFVLVFPLMQVMPGSDNGHFEDSYESFYCVSQSRELQLLILIYIFSCSSLNISSVMVTYSFNAIHRTMLEATRTSVIWGVGLYVHYKVDPSIPFGEKWLPFSWLEALGFVFLLFGQMIYGEVIKCPCFNYETK